METIHPGVTGRGTGEDNEPLAVSPRRACRLLDVGNTKLYALLAAGELESYRDGRSRKIVMASIRHRIARLLAETGATDNATQPRKRGRPSKDLSYVRRRLDELTRIPANKAQP